jgi:bisphosphoglycerate-dependent phosphoglycerate mutase
LFILWHVAVLSLYVWGLSVGSLQRAQQTLEIALKISGQEHVPVNANWRLNERMYGALTG